MSRTHVSSISRAIARQRPILPVNQSLTPVRFAGSATKDWEGRQANEHTTNRDDSLNIHSSASNAGQADRAKGDGGQSGATSQQDKGNQNEQAEKDHPEAPKPVIGMNDERGGVSVHSTVWVCQLS